ncbi:MAG: TolC family protein [Gammaproteobacteria bacterium]|nr:TolC family protein [Gammaproteobacteria bacterium]
MNYLRLWVLVILTVIAGVNTVHALELTIKDAETVAIQNDPLIAEFQANAQSFMEESVADGQLPDPKFRVGAVNFPIIGNNAFSFNSEGMTQAIVGINQGFPSKGMLEAKTEKKLLMAEAERAKAVDRAMTVLRNLRKAWMEVYLQTHSLALVKESEEIFNQLVKVTRYQYRAGRGQQQDVIRAQLELSLLQDREDDIQQMREKAIAELEKWTGASVRKHALSTVFPQLPTLPTVEELDHRLENHPSLAVKKAMLGASRKDVLAERSTFKPSWNVDISYGYRADGVNSADGSVIPRSDFLSAVVSVDMPFFTEKRQNRRLNAKGHLVNSASDAADGQRRELKRLLDASYADWFRLGDRLKFYMDDVLPKAAQYSESSRKSYQSQTSDFSELVRARLRELDSNLQTLRLRVERAKAHYDLQYLAGEA